MPISGAGRGSVASTRSPARLAPVAVPLLAFAFLAQPAACRRGRGSGDSRARVEPDGTAVLAGTAWTVRIHPSTLAIDARASGRRGVGLTLARPLDPPARVEGLSSSGAAVSWTLPERGLSLSASLADEALTVRVASSREQRLEWPETGAGARAAIVPESEGRYVPLDDAFWIRHLARECGELWGGPLPFWGFETGAGTSAYFLTDGLRSSLCWTHRPGSPLSLTLTHEFLDRDGRPPLELHVRLAPDSPIGPALVYRDWLAAEGRLVPLAVKIERNPEVAKLAGAMHAYLWGDGRTPQAIYDLRALGVDRAFLAYDQDPRHERHVVDRETVSAARAAGFLIGPYDTLNNVQDPRTADSLSSVFDRALFRTGGVMNEDGRRAAGFHGRGFHLSSEALRRAKRDFLRERVDEAVALGANAYFLDVDAAGELYDDFDPAHPMTLAKDRENRLARMRFIARTEGLVLGSESAAGWATPVIDVSHGTLTPKSPRLWAVLRDRELVGGYWPPERPRVMFQAADAPADLVRLTFDPRDRLPLFEAVFHDSVVAADFWGLPLPKFRNVERTRTLLLLLYGVPSLWHLDRRAIREEGERIAALDRFFSPLHRRLAREPLTGFEWLSSDRLVQRTRFGDAFTLTANFGDAPYGDLPPGCVVAASLEEGTSERFCP